MEDIAMEDVFIGVAVMLGIMVIMIIAVAIMKKSRDSQDESCPVMRKKAKILEKEQLPQNTIMALSEMNVLFEVEGGQRLRLHAKAQNHLIPGDEGYLTWQGSKVINFERI